MVWRRIEGAGFNQETRTDERDDDEEAPAASKSARTEIFQPRSASRPIAAISIADGGADEAQKADVGAVLPGVGYTAADDIITSTPVKEGIYEFVDTTGKKYVGQSSDIPQRLQQHVDSGKLDTGQHVDVNSIPGSTKTRDRGTSPHSGDHWRRARSAIGRRVQPTRSHRTQPPTLAQ